MTDCSRGARQQRPVAAGGRAADGAAAARLIRRQTSADAVRAEDGVAVWCDRMLLPLCWRAPCTACQPCTVCLLHSLTTCVPETRSVSTHVDSEHSPTLG